MIAWMSAAALQARLRAYPPIGLWLRAWFHARCDADPRAAIGTPAELHDDEGLGAVSVWCGIARDVPFAIRSAAAADGAGHGIDVMLPVRRGGDAAHLDTLAQLIPHLPPWRAPYFVQLPVAAGFVVVGDGRGAAAASIYHAARREDAAAVAAFANDASIARTYTVVAAAPAPAAEPFVVVGPDAGPYISRVETAASIDAAQRLAKRWFAETGATFEVRHVPGTG